MAQNDFLICKVKGGGVVVATATADNTTYGKSDKSIWWLLNIHYTSTSLQSNLYVLVILLCKIPITTKSDGDKSQHSKYRTSNTIWDVKNITVTFITF